MSGGKFVGPRGDDEISREPELLAYETEEEWVHYHFMGLYGGLNVSKFMPLIPTGPGYLAKRGA